MRSSTVKSKTVKSRDPSSPNLLQGCGVEKELIKKPFLRKIRKWKSSEKCDALKQNCVKKVPGRYFAGWRKEFGD